MKITIDLPADYVAKLKTQLAKLDIPETFIGENLRSAIVSEQYVQDWNLWYDFWVYPSRAAARRVARRIYRRYRWRHGQVKLWFREKGRDRCAAFEVRKDPLLMKRNRLSFELRRAEGSRAAHIAKAEVRIASITAALTSLEKQISRRPGRPALRA